MFTLDLDPHSSSKLDRDPHFLKRLGPNLDQHYRCGSKTLPPKFTCTGIARINLIY
jgi:hypothetical protein